MLQTAPSSGWKVRLRAGIQGCIHHGLEEGEAAMVGREEDTSPGPLGLDSKVDLAPIELTS